MKFIANKKSPSLIELNELINLAFARWVAHTGPQTLWASCATCINMKKQGPAFCQKYNCVPPVKVIVGEEDCPGYLNENEIPY